MTAELPGLAFRSGRFDGRAVSARIAASAELPAHDVAAVAGALATGTFPAEMAGLLDGIAGATLSDPDLPAGDVAELGRAVSSIVQDPVGFFLLWEQLSCRHAVGLLQRHPESFTAVRCGPWQAAYQNRGRYSLLYRQDDLRDAVVFDQGDYFTDHNAASCALVARGRTTVLLVGVDWDHLELWDLNSGALLAGFGDGDPFLGRLTPERSGRFVAVEGWCWHPFHTISLIDLDHLPTAPAGLDGLESAPLDWVFDRPVAWADIARGPALVALGVTDDTGDISCRLELELFMPLPGPTVRRVIRPDRRGPSPRVDAADLGAFVLSCAAATVTARAPGRPDVVFNLDR